MRSRGDKYRRLQSWVDAAESNTTLSVLVQKHLGEIMTDTSDYLLDIFHYTYLRMSVRDINPDTFVHDWRRLYIATRNEIDRMNYIDNAKINSYADTKESIDTED